MSEKIENLRDFVMNPQVIDGIYENETPQLEKVEVLGLEFDYQGAANMKIVLPNYPQNPPKKWKLKNYKDMQLNYFPTTKLEVIF